jgi:hypothetical protein
MSPLDFFLKRTVIVSIEGLRVKGQLIGYSVDAKENHKPQTMVLETKSHRLIVLRGSWTTIGEPAC